MDIVFNSEMMAGGVMASALVGAVAASPLFRNVGLAVTAAIACVVYVQSGIDGFSAMIDGLAADLLANADFGKGLALGGVFTAVLALAARLRRPA